MKSKGSPLFASFLFGIEQQWGTVKNTFDIKKVIFAKDFLNGVSDLTFSSQSDLLGKELFLRRKKIYIYTFSRAQTFEGMIQHEFVLCPET